MADEKSRVSGESPREAKGPLLPTSTADAAISEKAQAPKPAFHPALYVMYAPTSPLESCAHTDSYPST
ncbi:hypothetical protein RRF57_005198 [Xylaria bambusicola]|uniref:Uncharacterized protein n=1 Tax=Xylaria bambusicola TaxID=326684 RepID=A0AAN7Z7I3_9PEZI